MLNIKCVFNSPIECLLGTDSILTSKTGTETYIFSWKMVLKIVNRKTRTQGCHIGCEEAHGIHISCGSSNNDIGVMSSNKSEFLE